MNIVCATDDNFVQHCCIMLVSLLFNNKDVNIFILTEGLKYENEVIIREEIERLNGSVNFCKVDSEIVSKFPMPELNGLSHISRATYYRLLIADILPQKLSKAIYLDCDMIINGSIKPLWDIDLSDYALAASLQVGYGSEAVRLGYPIKYGYFNAGMNVINLEYFRRNNISERLINYIKENFSKIKFHDQDVLNAVLHEKTLHVMPQWNLTSIAFVPFLKRRGDRIKGKLINDYSEEKNNIKKYRNSPNILHYVSKPKPWQIGCIHPLYDMYYLYAEKTIHYKNLPKQTNIRRFPYILKFKIVSYISRLKQYIVQTDKSLY